MIRNPMKPGDPVWDMAFNLYAMEEEGLLMTHRSILNNFCDIITHMNIDIYDQGDFFWACEEAGVDWVLTDEDIDYIYERTGVHIINYSLQV